jgi:ankyrin repeat protein
VAAALENDGPETTKNERVTTAKRQAHKDAAAATRHHVPRAARKNVDPRRLIAQAFHAADTGDVAALVQIVRRLPAVSQLVAATDDFGWNLLHVAASGGHEPLVEYLLQLGFDPRSRTEADAGLTAQELAVRAGFSELADRILHFDPDAAPAFASPDNDDDDDDEPEPQPQREPWYSMESGPFAEVYGMLRAAELEVGAGQALAAFCVAAQRDL